jgi:hypothetical protein
LKDEKWIHIKTTDSYYISDLGKVYCTRTGEQVKPYLKVNSYKFKISKDGIRSDMVLDQTVFFSFNPNIKILKVII